MGTINFVITRDTAEHVFSTNTFKYMYSSYSSGTTGSIYVYFAAEGDMVDPDLITLTVNKNLISNVIENVARGINNNSHTVIKHSQPSGLYKNITAITYTAG